MTVRAATARLSGGHEGIAMLGRFGRDAGSLLGVEITSGGIRMMQARQQAGQYRVIGWACEKLELPRPGGPDPMVNALRQAHRRCATRQRQVAVALPASQVICKVCQVPQGACAQAIETQLLAEAGQLFPFPLDDLALDFQVLQPSASQPEAVDVLVAACRQSQLDPLEQQFAEAGLELVAVEVDSFALRRVLGPAPSVGVALLQMEREELVLHRWQPDQLPQRQHLPLAASGQWCEAVSGLLQLNGDKIDELVLSGVAADAATARRLSEQSGVSCRVVALPLANLPAGFSSAAMALACGLAMGGLR
ncbi:pilus assembly protein PilM [Pseudomonas xanthosomatis]|uniref:type IV pilus biogenesis protein PilM n=1 Tax=Pseudomonas xanthosomatis TaxID=2842356 RepID=UPI001C3D67BE|nr:pilus assembly protein PilM [Pseudomonas xanthosomatis]QXH47035.1 pilus assembly protein PilM [Pseudomonas xanthosomatis]